jgi:Phage derived protein Gp49-like (DUF891)
MSDLIYLERRLVWLHGEIKTLPFSTTARIEAGFLLRCLQRGWRIGMPHARPMSAIGPRCLELRIPDVGHNWRIFCRTDPDAILVLAIHDKKERRVSPGLLALCRVRAEQYDRDSLEDEP